MLVVEIVIAAVILFAVAAVAAGRGGSLSDSRVDAPDPGLPEDRRLTSDDVPRLRFRLAWRGYRMDDVDAAVDGLRESLVALEERLVEVPVANEPIVPAPSPTPAEPMHPHEPVQPEQPPRPDEPARPLEPVVPPAQPAPQPHPPAD